MKQVKKYFPDLTKVQVEQLSKLKALYSEWNAQINVISRKDIENFYERHVLHSLSIAEMIQFKPGSKMLDVGTGGGFPGIPLAILFPESNFHLVDSVGKKIKVVNEVVEALKLKNVTAEHVRAENVKGKFDFILSRAVTRMNKFIPWVQNKVLQEDKNILPNGIFYLKGGDLQAEMSEIHQDYDVLELADLYKEEFFETKKVVYVRLNLR
ncbi:MAG: 16S rRNA (guanine527-N7)-methyltransferase [Parvicellaceae bacterium]